MSSIMKNYLLKTIMLTSALLMGFGLHAQLELPIRVSKVCSQTGKPTPKITTFCSNGQTDEKQLIEHARKTVAKAEGDMYTVTFNLEYDVEFYQAPFFAYIFGDNDFLQLAFDNGEGALQGQVPPGTYDIVAYFMHEDIQYYVIYEQYEVTEDVTLALNPTQSTNLISTKAYGPDGDLLKCDLGHVDENGEWVVDDIGNIDNCGANNTLYLKGRGPLISFTVSYTGGALDEESRSRPLDFYINDVSDRFVFIQERVAYTADLSKSYVCYLSTDDVKIGVRENNPNDYVQQLYTYKYSPYGRSQEMAYGIQNLIWSVGNDYAYTALGVNTGAPKNEGNFTHEVWANLPLTNPFVPEMNIFVQTVFPDYGEIEHMDFGDYEYDVFTFTGVNFAQVLRANNGQKEFVNIGHHRFENEFLMINDLYGVFNDGKYYYRLNPPEAFTYPANQAFGVINDNCPINAVKVRSYEAEGQVNLQVQNYFVGRFGECLSGGEGVTMGMKFNGTDVDMETFTLEEKGTCEWTSTNTNIEVDDMPGHNITTVYFDQNQEDMTPPSIEMLHFKNGDGGVTDRFASADDGTMEFYAGDFNYQYYPEMWDGEFEFDCQPVEVLVEYAPYGTENWNELAVEEVPELYQMPGWGYFYRGSLAGVTGQAEKGWFDLKIRLVDEAGNWQEQVVSPAFRIDDLAYSSVANIGDGNAREVARYNLAGQRVDASHKGVTIIRMSDGTARKVLK